LFREGEWWLISPVVWGGEKWRSGYLQIAHPVEAVVTTEVFCLSGFFFIIRDELPKNKYNLSISAMLEASQLAMGCKFRRTSIFHKFSLVSAGPGLMFWIAAIQNSSSHVCAGTILLS